MHSNANGCLKEELVRLEIEYVCIVRLTMHKEGILEPGLNTSNRTALHQFQILHAQCKEKLQEFVTSMLAGASELNFDSTLFFFHVGRYEFRNKGIDLIIESLARKFLKMLETDFWKVPMKS